MWKRKMWKIKDISLLTFGHLKVRINSVRRHFNTTTHWWLKPHALALGWCSFTHFKPSWIKALSLGGKNGKTTFFSVWPSCVPAVYRSTPALWVSIASSTAHPCWRVSCQASETSASSLWTDSACRTTSSPWWIISHTPQHSDPLLRNEIIKNISYL